VLGPGETEKWSSLEHRVERLEEDMADVKSTLRMIESRLGAIEVSLAKLDGRITGVEGRLQALPTAWQMFTAIVTSAVATWSAGAAIVFTLLRFAPK
jgi:uncharacterized coiled-coil protein SlyX